MTSNKKVNLLAFALLAVAVIAVMTAPTALAVKSPTQTLVIRDFEESQACVLTGISARYNMGTANDDGDLSTKAKVHRNTSGVMTAFAWENVSLKKGDKVKITVEANTLYKIGEKRDRSNQGGEAKIVAYLAKPGSIYDNTRQSGCWTNGAFSGSGAWLVDEDSKRYDFERNKKNSAVSTINIIPKDGVYPVVIYAESSSHKNGSVTAKVWNPTITLDIN